MNEDLNRTLVLPAVRSSFESALEYFGEYGVDEFENKQYDTVN